MLDAQANGGSFANVDKVIGKKQMCAVVDRAETRYSFTAGTLPQNKRKNQIRIMDARVIEDTESLE